MYLNFRLVKCLVLLSAYPSHWARSFYWMDFDCQSQYKICLCCLCHTTETFQLKNWNALSKSCESVCSLRTQTHHLMACFSWEYNMVSKVQFMFWNLNWSELQLKPFCRYFFNNNLTLYAHPAWSKPVFVELYVSVTKV